MNGIQENKNLFLCSVCGTLAALGVSALLAAAVSAVCMASSDPMSYSALGYAVLMLGSAVGGFVSRRRYGHGSPMCYLLSGMMFTACVLCASVLGVGGQIKWFLPPLSVLCSVPGGIAGGVGIVSSARPDFKSNKNADKFKKYRKDIKK